MDGSLTRRKFLTYVGTAAVSTSFMPRLLANERSEARRPNVVLITADDMDYYSMGVTGCKIPGITPNIDALAGQGMTITHAHVTSAICQPSRSAIMTGRFPHRNGAQGFEPISDTVPTLVELLRQAGYLNGILSKEGHLEQPAKFPWDVVVSRDKLHAGRDPELYYKHSKAFFEQAREEGKPFFLMANSEDPHRPFPDSEQEATKPEDFAPKATRHYKPEEVEIPGFLPDDIQDIRKEVAQYFTAVHRCDEAVGGLMRALKETGFEDNTLVIFLSDNGMAFPFAKTNCYEASTRTPFIVRWPGRVKVGAVNDETMVSGIDIMPTVLEATGAKMIGGMDGRSFVPTLEGKREKDRDKVFTFITKTVSTTEYPMRSVRTKRYGYIFNAWADGETVFQNESQSGLTFKAMETAAENDPKIAERVKLFQYRVPEELYDLQADRWEMNNLAADPKHKATLDKMRAELLDMMKSTNDPLFARFKEFVGK